LNFQSSTSQISNAEWLKRLSIVECRDSTYLPRTDPIVFKKALGSKIWDSEGKQYYDLCAGFGALPLGHNSEALRDVCEGHLQRALPPIDHAMGDVYPSEEKIIFLETLRSALPSHLTKGCVALSGGQSVEIAVKTAVLFTKNTGFIVFDDGYHGLDLGILPLTARQDFRLPFKDWLPETSVIRLPLNCDQSRVSQAIDVLESKSCGFAGILVEPVQGRAGIKTANIEWLKCLAALTKQHQAVLIFDEVFTGFGRIGSITTATQVDVDLVCFGKAIGGGFPISACFGRESVMNAWPESTGEALHTGTFFGHPFAAHVGRLTVEAILKQGLAQRSLVLGEEVRQVLRSKLSASEHIVDVRGVGLMIAIEFNKPGFAAQLMDLARPLGVIVLPSGSTGSVLSLTPALNISEAELYEALNILCGLVSSL
jgi:4-aminobutyrate aminotransferase-like enzyme